MKMVLYRYQDYWKCGLSAQGLHIQSSGSHGNHIDFMKVSYAPLDIVLIG